MQTAIVGGDVTALKAREAFQAYRKLMREGRGTEDDETLMRAYRAIAQGKRVLDLRATLMQAGLDEQLRPRLAIARADEKAAHFEWSSNLDCWLFTHGTNWRRPSIVSGRTIPVGRNVFPVLLPPWASNKPQKWNALRAAVPPIPAELRPTAGLDKFHILWEAEWQPIAPKDPILLKRIGGFLYAVVAQWDLTELERAVLGARLS